MSLGDETPDAASSEKKKRSNIRKGRIQTGQDSKHSPG